MLTREQSEQDQLSTLNKAQVSMSRHRSELSGLLEETRRVHSKYGAEYRELQARLAQVTSQLDQLQKTNDNPDNQHELAIETNSLREQDSQIRQRSEWLSDKLIELQTAINKLRVALQQIDDIAGFLSSDLSGDRHSEDNNTQFSRVRLLQAQEDERHRLAREIHDGPAQVLVNAIFGLEYCERLLEKNPQQMKPELTRVKQDLRDGLSEVRYFISNLRPVALAEFGLGPVLRRYIENYETRFSINVQADTEGLERLPQHQELAIFRIIQEALQNSRKHSGATEIQVQFVNHPDAIEINIQDNGKGFDVQAAREREGQHFGLSSMAERARLIGAELDIASNTDGTRVTLTIPVTGDTDDV